MANCGILLARRGAASAGGGRFKCSQRWETHSLTVLRRYFWPLYCQVPRRDISQYCLRLDLVALWSFEGRYVWITLAQHGGRWLSHLPHVVPVCQPANSGILVQKNTADKPGNDKWPLNTIPYHPSMAIPLLG